MLEDRVMTMPSSAVGGKLASYEIPSFPEMLAGGHSESEKWERYSKGLISALGNLGDNSAAKPVAFSASADEMTDKFLKIMEDAEPDADSSKYSDILFGDDISELDDTDSDVDNDSDTDGE